MTRPLYYTFGNHMHWVDMQWLWGYGVLPGCVDDMIRLIEETGARGNVNFDAVGYEKMAAECPDTLARLARAVETGDVEPVGCSYGQPYGLFHGGESNIRQFTFGVRTTLRLLRARPATFWEEEFYFFDQLPQILRRCGFSGACLFFQWTWHTPELPHESAGLIQWQGIDGSTLPALPRNALNVHQWPEDFDGLLARGLVNELEHPAVVQWLELMPSRDWMCRSEVLLPRLMELMSDKRFDVRPRTCQELIAELQEHTVCRTDMEIPTRRYRPDDVWHGMTLGKNADRHPRTSRQTEQMILAGESISSLASILGRPYASWDVYPTWELDEAWRELLAAQHHDNHECEGLCGFVGYHQIAKAQRLAEEVICRAHAHLEDRGDGPVSFNPLGWPRRVERMIFNDDQSPQRVLVELPAFGYVGSACAAVDVTVPRVRRDGAICTLARGNLEVDVDVERGRIVQIRSDAKPNGILNAASPILDLRMIVNKQRWSIPALSRHEIDESACEIDFYFEEDDLRRDELPRVGTTNTGRNTFATIRIPATGDSVDILIRGIDGWTRPDPGLVAALRMPIAIGAPIESIRADSPYAIEEVRGGGRVSRKYPEGDWMTSPQWFEHVEGSIVSHSLIDLLTSDGSGLLVLHDGAQQWFRTQDGVEVVLNAYDPWDERRYAPDPLGDMSFRLIPHNGLRDVERARRAHEFVVEASESNAWIENAGLGRALESRPVGGGDPTGHPIPPSFAPIDIAGDDNILCHALYRQSSKSGEHLPDWAGHEMVRRSDGACTHPFVVRLVEWNGEPGEAILSLPGRIASAARTNLMGEVGPNVGGGEDTLWLTPEPAAAPAGAKRIDVPGGWSRIRIRLKPREIATIMLDLELGRKQWRDLDAKRNVWATIHRKSEGESS